MQVAASDAGGMRLADAACTTMHAICYRRGIIGAAVLLLLLIGAPAVRACVWGYRVHCTVPTTKFAIPVERETYPTRDDCWDSARTACQSLARWCAYALRNQGTYQFKQTDLDWCRDALRVKAERLEGFCRAEIIR
jgi:hypothetical protein